LFNISEVISSEVNNYCKYCDFVFAKALFSLCVIPEFRGTPTGKHWWVQSVLLSAASKWAPALLRPWQVVCVGVSHTELLKKETSFIW
jgi:hypothetical protein